MADISKYMANEENKTESFPFMGVSIITVNNGRNPKWMNRAMRSVLAQETELPIEHIIVDNINNDKTQGEAYNDGITSSRTALVYILDDDDELHPKAIDESVKALMDLKMKDLTYFRVASYQMLISETGEQIGTTTYPNIGLLDKELVRSLGGFKSIQWKEHISPLVPDSRTILFTRAEKENLKSVMLKSHLYAKRVHRGQTFFNKFQPLYEEVLWNLDNDRHISPDGTKLVDYNYIEYVNEEVKGFIFNAPRRNVAVGIVTHNSSAEIGKCLANVSKYSPPGTKVLLFDNNSTDRTKKVVEKTLKEFQIKNRVIWNEENVNKVLAMSYIVDAAKADESIDYLMFLDPNAYVTQNWAKYMVDCFEGPTREFCGIVGVQEIDPIGRAFHNLVAKVPDVVGSDSIQNVALDWLAIGKTPVEIEVPAVSFSSAMIKRRAFEVLNLDEKFSTSMFAGIDFGNQIKSAGLSIWSTPYVDVMHYSTSQVQESDEELEKCNLKADYEYFVSKWGEKGLDNVSDWMKKFVGSK